jgi:hypothetical protein
MSFSEKVWFLALLFLTLFGPDKVDADTLSMPYSCQLEPGGKPILLPSDIRDYRIFGHKEQRRFEACSPINPSACRDWTIYKFDLECGGRRISWLSIADAASREKGGTAWALHGRLHIEMPMRWAFPQDRCSYPWMAARGWRRYPDSRFCSERNARMPPPVIDLPEGFAPMMGLHGTFNADPIDRRSQSASGEIFARAPREAVESIPNSTNLRSEVTTAPSVTPKIESLETGSVNPNPWAERQLSATLQKASTDPISSSDANRSVTPASQEMKNASTATLIADVRQSTGGQMPISNSQRFRQIRELLGQTITFHLESCATSPSVWPRLHFGSDVDFSS